MAEQPLFKEAEEFIGDPDQILLVETLYINTDRF